MFSALLFYFSLLILRNENTKGNENNNKIVFL